MAFCPVSRPPDWDGIFVPFYFWAGRYTLVCSWESRRRRQYPLALFDSPAPAYPFTRYPLPSRNSPLATRRPLPRRAPSLPTLPFSIRPATPFPPPLCTARFPHPHFPPLAALSMPKQRPSRPSGILCSGSEWNEREKRKKAREEREERRIRALENGALDTVHDGRVWTLPAPPPALRPPPRPVVATNSNSYPALVRAARAREDDAYLAHRRAAQPAEIAMPRPSKKQAAARKNWDSTLESIKTGTKQALEILTTREKKRKLGKEKENAREAAYATTLYRGHRTIPTDYLHDFEQSGAIEKFRALRDL
ncbi:hypothetical protein B0H13DRAFT_2363431 [Mycena leptocephala]|nr:hypothetical protein B0H13DRAFT_2363431 [Mycena leptocephala]